MNSYPLSKIEIAGLKTLMDVAVQARTDWQEAIGELVKRFQIPDGAKIDFKWEDRLLVVMDPAKPEEPKPLEVLEGGSK